MYHKAVHAALEAVEFQLSLAIGWPYQIFNTRAISALAYTEIHEWQRNIHWIYDNAA
jgi:outer membrane phospholipase A